MRRNLHRKMLRKMIRLMLRKMVRLMLRKMIQLMFRSMLRMNHLVNGRDEDFILFRLLNVMLQYLFFDSQIDFYQNGYSFPS